MYQMELCKACMRIVWRRWYSDNDSFGEHDWVLDDANSLISLPCSGDLSSKFGPCLMRLDDWICMPGFCTTYRDHCMMSGVSCPKIPPKNPPNVYLVTSLQHWLGIAKPKNVFRSTLNLCIKLLWNLKISYSTDFSTDWLTIWLTDAFRQ